MRDKLAEDRLTRRLYMRVYRLKNKDKINARNQEKRWENIEKTREWRRKWYRDNPLYYEKRNRNLKLRALQMISGLEKPVCKECGCDDIRVLEENHKNLGGSAERKRYHSPYYAVISGKRKTDDLDVLCRVCNAVHYLEKKFGLKFAVEFLGESN